MNKRQQLKILPVLIIVAMMAFSVRLVDFMSGVSSLSGSAFAKSEKMEEHVPAPDEMKLAKAEAPVEESHGEPKDDHKTEEMEPPPMDWRDASDEELDYLGAKNELLKDISGRRKKLDQRERELQTREALLRAAEQELDRKYQELSMLRGEIENLLERQSEEELARIQSLVKIYEGMKPKEAARIFDTLDLDVLMTVMSRMSERRLSPILANMNPERARTITILLAEEKQLPSLPRAN